MNEKKPFSSLIKILNIIAIAFCLVTSLFIVFSPDSVIRMRIAAVLDTAALVFALVYLFKGYKKDAALFYKLFMAFVSLAYLANVVVQSGSDTAITDIVIACATLAFGIAVTLAFAKDLGKKLSLELCGVLLALNIFEVIASVVVVPEAMREDSALVMMNTFRCGSNLWLSVNMCIMIYAKYIDKASRGSK